MKDPMDSYHSEVISSEPEARPKSGRSVWAWLVDLLETLVLAVLLFLGINAISARIRVEGFSMEPTLHDGELVIVSKAHYMLGEPRRGDVIVFHYPRNPDEEYIKRVIGLPGDLVVISQGQVIVNDQVLDEAYIASPPVYETAETVVPEDSLFVLGDNRNNSSDSHQWGPVPMKYVIGKAFLVYWPPDDWGLIDHVVTAGASP